MRFWEGELPVLLHGATIAPSEAAVSKQEQCQLLQRLPAELCNRIFSYAVVRQGPIQLHVETRSTEGGWEILEPLHRHRIRTNERRRLHPALPSLLMVCRRIYREVKPIYFQDNVFAMTDSIFEDTDSIRAFRKFAGKSAISLHTMKVFRSHWAKMQGNSSTRVWIRFEIKKSGHKIEVKGKVARNGEVIDTGFGEHELCTCEMLGLARKFERDEDAILKFIEGYVAAITPVAYSSHPAYLSKCPECGTLKLNREATDSMSW